MLLVSRGTVSTVLPSSAGNERRGQIESTSGFRRRFAIGRISGGNLLP
jgi:hypothetical protein